MGLANDAAEALIAILKTGTPLAGPA